MQIIGLTGPIGSGKTAAALALCTVGFTRIRFAQPLKDMLKALGLSDVELDGSLKEQPCDKLDGRTPRHAMQTLGTEWGRDCMGPGLWVNLWKRKALSADAPIVVDDVRFENEMNIIQRLGGKVIFVQRICHQQSTSTHSSERFAYTPDAIWQNDGDLGQWHETVKAKAKELFPT
jgi:hypothetical protein